MLAPYGKFIKNFLLNLYQTLLEWSLDGSFSELFLMMTLQDGLVVLKKVSYIVVYDDKII